MSGLVSSGHPCVSEAAAEILRAGGNAFDAIVAAGFASTAAEPLLNSLGGGGFALTRTTAGEEVLFDFFPDTPGVGNPPADPGALDFDEVVVDFSDAQQTFHVGWASAAVPGTLKGLIHVHERLGRLPLAEVVAPAISLARDGVVVNDFQSYLFTILEPIIRYGSESNRYFVTSADRLLATGELQRNAELAAFLEDLPTQPDSLYRGDLAALVARDMEQGGGLLTRRDLERYRVIERRPLTVSYRGIRLLTNPPPSLGGPLLALALTLQEAVDLSTEEWGSPGHVKTLVAVLTEVERIRTAGGPLPRLGDAELAEAQEAVRISTGGTTHMNVADAEGNVASLSLSNGEGCGHYVAGTGIMLNNMMGEDDLHPDGFHQSEAGSRISSMMAPSMLTDDRGVIAALGTGGSKRIRTALQQAITNLVDFRLHADAAVNRPRLHISQGVLHVEPGYPQDVLSALQDLGTTNLWESQNVFFGGVHVVLPRTGEGGGDRRRAGHFMAVRLELPAETSSQRDPESHTTQEE